MTHRTILAAALLLAVPLTAAAQYDPRMVAAYHAMNQINAEVWADNPNQAEAARHAMMIARNWGIYPGFEPSQINPDIEPHEETVGEGCFWYYDDEAGEWRERCSDWHTYRCNTAKQIEDLHTLKEGAGWYALFWGSAAFYAYHVAVFPEIGGAFTVLGITFAGYEKWLGYKLEQMEANRCVLP